MTDQKLKRAQSLVGYSTERADNDYYPTNPATTRLFLEMEQFDGPIWEPACGEGHMSEVLKEYGYAVKSTDLIDRGYGTGGIDFLSCFDEVENIVTNPPYAIAQEFIEHALACTTKKVAMLCKLQILEGAKRKKMFENSPLARVYVYSKRQTLMKNGDKATSSGMIAYCFLVFEHGYEGEPTIRWI